jgi:hypothetical protein
MTPKATMIHKPMMRSLRVGIHGLGGYKSEYCLNTIKNAFNNAALFNTFPSLLPDGSYTDDLVCMYSGCCRYGYGARVWQVMRKDLYSKHEDFGHIFQAIATKGSVYAIEQVYFETFNKSTDIDWDKVEYLRWRSMEKLYGINLGARGTRTVPLQGRTVPLQGRIISSQN